MRNIELKEIKEIEILFKVIGDSTRLKIMFSLLDESLCKCGCLKCEECKHMCCAIEKSVNEIVEDTLLEQSLISHQLKVLKQANLINSRKDGKHVIYRIKDSHVKALLRIANAHIKEKLYEENL